VLSRANGLTGQHITLRPAHRLTRVRGCESLRRVPISPRPPPHPQFSPYCVHADFLEGALGNRARQRRLARVSPTFCPTSKGEITPEEAVSVLRSSR
jgi:hypothetical protein